MIPSDAAKVDFVKGNVKARARMVAQYEIAGYVGGLVLGTDHSAENITGFIPNLVMVLAIWLPYLA